MQDHQVVRGVVMGKRMTREELLGAVFPRWYEELKGRELCTVQVQVVGEGFSSAQLIGVTDRRVYENLGLYIGTHLGEDRTGQSIGLLHLIPRGVMMVIANVAMKSGNVGLDFLGQFNGMVILLGSRAGVKGALEHVVEFFRTKLGFTVCELTER